MVFFDLNNPTLTKVIFMTPQTGSVKPVIYLPGFFPSIGQVKEIGAFRQMRTFAFAVASIKLHNVSSWKYSDSLLF